ncbi:DNA replication/repair protein RecF [Roseibium sp. RKSG952]|uniref:DNA replication/repair protein RecF n=1 Tax=Roseibium sp. RKSG952 TaxID=2529384 RepID=UPI0012BCFBC5|nr:DNA replication/repair protein RecF [Roseibium sp. RKSG952]MTH99756.1 DNA replication/repair protein RecF [Roseibium sp. RKSG952]
MSGSAPAFITRLTLSDFRNHERLDIKVGAPLVAFVGDNGAGKTNILEAISFLTAGRGIRRAALADIARHDGSGGWSVSARIESDGLESQIGTGFSAGNSGRKVRIDGEDIRTTETLLDYVRVLWLVPSMDGLFTGPAGDRRRFLDRLTLSIDPAHGRRVGDFEKALRHRNKLLDQDGGDSFLSAIETQVAELGTAVSLARLETVSLLSTALSRQTDGAAVFPKADIVFEGEFESRFAAMPATEAETGFLEMLKNSRFRDRQAGRTLLGPHLSDLQVRHSAKNMPASRCSTGEQKALLIGLILAHAELTRSVTGTPPILLLDEVAAHLDPGRRAGLFAKLSEIGGQVFMTGTDEALFDALPDNDEIHLIAHPACRLLRGASSP